MTAGVSTWPPGTTADDAAQAEQGGTIQEGGVQSPGSPGQHEEADSLPAAGETCQHPELLPQHHRQCHEEVPPQDSWRHFWSRERGGDLQHHQSGGERGADEDDEQTDVLSPSVQSTSPGFVVWNISSDRHQLCSEWDQHDSPGTWCQVSQSDQIISKLKVKYFSVLLHLSSTRVLPREVVKLRGWRMWRGSRWVILSKLFLFFDQTLLLYNTEKILALLWWY